MYVVGLFAEDLVKVTTRTFCADKEKNFFSFSLSKIATKLKIFA